MKLFPNGVKRLWYDVEVYRNIHDASRTKLNAWTVDHPRRRKRKHGQRPGGEGYGTTKLSSKKVVYDDEARPGRIPRRQYEQQRRLVEDLSKVGPLVALWIPPIIGYLPMLLAMFAPRQVLSRQFLNDYEVHQYAELEYRQRKSLFPTVASMFWTMTAPRQVVVREGKQVGAILQETEPPQRQETGEGVEVEEKGQEFDAAGPIIDAFPYYPVFTDAGNIVVNRGDDIVTTGNPDTISDSVLKSSAHRELLAGVLTSVDDMPREYLVPFALAVGINQNFPLWFSRFVTDRLTPSRWLRYRVNRVALVVAEDDDNLLLENYHLDGCQSLTEVEAMDACLMRGLPIGIPTADQRVCLTNHLNTIASVKERLATLRQRQQPDTEEEDNDDENDGIGQPMTQAEKQSFGLFTLHIPIIRDFFKQQQQQKVKHA